MAKPRVFVLGLLALTVFAVLVPVSTAAQAAKERQPIDNGFSGHSRGCSVATIVGDWGFKTDGYYQASGALDSFAVGIFKIRHDGALHGKYDAEGPWGFVSEVEIEGSVVVNFDCTGTLSFHIVGSDIVVTQSLAIAQNGKKILGMMQDPTIDVGTFTAIRIDEDE